MDPTETTPDPVAGIAAKITSNVSSLTAISAGDVFSAPVEHGDTVVITAAAVSRGGGFGFGGGGEPTEHGVEGGAGGGGGGGGEGRPVAVIEITPEGATVRPVFDVTKVGIAAIGALIALLRISRRR